MGGAGSSSIEDRKTGGLSVFNPLVSSGDAKFVYNAYSKTTDTRSDIRDAMSSVLSGNPDLAGSFFGWDDGGQGGLEAALSAGLKPGVNWFFGGIDAIDEAVAAVKNGQQVITMAQGNYAMVYWAIIAGWANITTGWMPPTDVVDVPMTSVTKANADTFTLIDTKMSDWAALGGPAISSLVMPK